MGGIVLAGRGATDSKTGKHPVGVMVQKLNPTGERQIEHRQQERTLTS
jgi:hypothetical protein